MAFKKGGPFYARLLKLVALLTPALIGVSLIFKTGGIRTGVKGAGVKKGPVEKGPIRYLFVISGAIFLYFVDVIFCYFYFQHNKEKIDNLVYPEQFLTLPHSREII